jgi:hypothetical protein
MGKITKNVFSTYHSQLGGGLPVKNCSGCVKNISKASLLNDSAVEPLYPTGVIISGQRNIQDNTEIEPLLPVGVTRITNNSGTIPDVRMQLAEACRIEYQGNVEVIDILDSTTFTFERADFEGIRHLYQASYKINDSGILSVNFLSVRQLEDRISPTGPSPMLPPINL